MSWATGLTVNVINACKEKGVITDMDVRNLIIESNNKIGASNDPALIKKSFDKFIFVTKNEFEIVNDGKKGNRDTFLISLKKEKSLEEILKVVELGYTDPRKFKKKTTSSFSKKEEIISEKRTVRRKKESNIRIDTLTKIMDTLLYSVQHNTNTVDCNVVSKIIEVKKIHSSTIKSWEGNLSKHGVMLDVCYLDREGRLIIRNAKDCLLSCCDLYKRLSGSEPDGKYKSAGISMVRSVKKEIIRNEDYDTVYFYTAGIIAENEFNAIDVESLCKYLGNNFGYGLTKRKLQDILKDRPEFSFIRYGEAIGLEKKNESWETIKSECSPKNKKLWVDCRLPMTLVEIKRFFPDTEELSIISEKDGFYRVHYDQSCTSLMTWYKLVTSFIGKDYIKDCIFDADLIIKIRKEVDRVDSLLIEGSIGYKLENLL